MRQFRVNLTLILVAFLATSTFAQIESEPSDTTEVSSDGFSFGDGGAGEEEEDSEMQEDGSIVEFKIDTKVDTTKNFITRWFTLGLGVNPVMVDGDFDLPAGSFYDDFDLKIGKSTNVDLGIVQEKINLVDHRLYLYTGVGLDINKYMFDNDFIINPDADVWQTTAFDTPDTKKNRLTTTYLHVPLMLNYETSKKHYESFRINAGGFVGLRLNSNQKIKLEDQNDDFANKGKRKYKERDNFNLNPVNYGLKTELGYGPINLYGKYHLNDMFKDDAAPELNNFSVGIMVVPF